MGPKAFSFALIFLGGMVAASAMPGIGVLIGLFFGFTVAFFVAPLAFGLQWLAFRAGLAIGLEQTLIALGLLYGACVLIALWRAWRTGAGGDPDRARAIGAKAALFAALPLAAYLSTSVMAAAWR